MINSLTGFGIPFIWQQPKSKEEKIEEARRSGYIKSNNPNDINPNREQLCCKACGSLRVLVGDPTFLDDEKGMEIPYICDDCGYIGTRVARFVNIEDIGNGEQRLVLDLVPDGLVGIAGTLIKEDD